MHNPQWPRLLPTPPKKPVPAQRNHAHFTSVSTSARARAMFSWAHRASDVCKMNCFCKQERNRCQSQTSSHLRVPQTPPYVLANTMLMASVRDKQSHRKYVRTQSSLNLSFTHTHRRSLVACIVVTLTPHRTQARVAMPHQSGQSQAQNGVQQLPHDKDKDKDKLQTSFIHSFNERCRPLLHGLCVYSPVSAAWRCKTPFDRRLEQR